MQRPNDTAARPLVEVRDLEVTYLDGATHVPAIKGISLDICAGERVAIIGPSGSGKTSLVRVLSGLRAPDAGHVRVGPHTMGARQPTRRMARDIGQVFQGFGLVPQATALQNVLCGRLYDYRAHRGLLRFRDDDRRRAAELLAGLGLGDRLHHRTAKLSGGEQQRVGVARLLFQSPRLALLDEPISNLDVHWAAEVMRQLEPGHLDGPQTVVMVLHDLNAVRRWADRTIFMRDGLVVFDGDPDHACRLLESTEQPTASATQAPAPGPTQATPSLPHDTPGLGRAAFYALAALALVGAYVWSLMGVDLDASQLFGGLGSAGSFLSRLLPPDFSVSATVFESLVETIQMAFIGTSLAALASLPLSILAAKNVSPLPIRSLARVFLNLLRTIPSIIWGLFFVAMVGLGPLPGILALTFYASGYLGKFYYEGIESISEAPVRALKTTGASRLQQFRHGVFPQVLPLLAGYTLYMFEYNVRAASILGVVGAGGIGFYLYTYINNFNYAKATTALLFLLVVVTVIDLASSWLRDRLNHA